MIYLFYLICMFFCHIIDDYYFQGILASLKQKNYWEKLDGYSKFYRHDYIVALVTHGFSWAFMILLPITIFYWPDIPMVKYCIVLVAQALIHAFIDNEKANKKRINLIQDQLMHIVQILFSWLIFMP